MIQIRKSQDRGHFNHGWLNTYHTFSFSEYFDPKFKGFRSLRVINEDWVGPSEGFDTHAHRDMEILTYIIDGSLEHKDSMGNGSVIGPGEIQYMSAGSGVTHSEFNPSSEEKVHLLQIWIFPDKKDYAPRYGQKKIPVSHLEGSFYPLAGPKSLNDSMIELRQDALLLGCKLNAKNTQARYTFSKNRFGWLQIALGDVLLKTPQTEILLEQGDGVAFSEEAEFSIQLKNSASAEALLFDLN